MIILLKYNQKSCKYSMKERLRRGLRKITHLGTMSGVSDSIVIQAKDLTYKCTPFIACFGSISNIKQQIQVYCNLVQIKDTPFKINQENYLEPQIPDTKTFAKLNLQQGKNILQFKLSKDDQFIEFEVYLYTEDKKLIISDVDGTLTKSNVTGMINNLFKRDYIHEGYVNFMKILAQNGYQIVWLTMRSISMYNITKDYISNRAELQGPLFTFPQQVFSALKKQLTKKTVDPKTKILKHIRQAFSEGVNPFVGAFGNNQNDGLAYSNVNVPQNRIYILNTESQIQVKGTKQKMSFFQLSLPNRIEVDFPKIKFTQGYSSSLDQRRGFGQGGKWDKEIDMKLQPDLRKAYSQPNSEKIEKHDNFQSFILSYQKDSKKGENNFQEVQKNKAHNISNNLS